MRFGIVVTDEKHSNEVKGLMAEALARDWSLRCFLTDTGVNLLKDETFVLMAGNELTHLSVCELSIERYCQELDLAALEELVVIGGQYQDAELVRNSDRVMVF